MKRLGVLAAASAAFADATADPPALSLAIVRVFTERLADACGILLADDDGKVLRLGAFDHRSDELRARIEQTLAARGLNVGTGLLGTAAQTLEPVLVGHVDRALLLASAHPDFRWLVEENALHTVLVLPIHLRGRCLGVLAMARDERPEPFDEDDLRLAQDIADRAAMALELSQLVHRERIERTRAVTLVETAKEIHTIELDRALHMLVRLGADLVGDACVVTLLEGPVLRAQVAAHRDPELDANVQTVVGTAITDPASPLLTVLREKHAVRIGDARDFRTDSPEAETYRRERGIASLVVCPLCVDGEVIGTLGVSRDAGGTAYTEHDEHFLQELADRVAHVIHNARLYQEARRANERKDEFLAAASHELRTPLATLTLVLQTIQLRLAGGAMPQEELIPRIDRAAAQVARLTGLVERMLDGARIGAGRLELAPEDTDLTALVRTVTQRFDDAAKPGRSRITVHAGDAIVGRWDREWLDQAVTNLIANALKYGGEAPVEIHIADRGTTAELSVVDHGIGIAPEHHERIFGRYERAVPNRNYPGFGIGLWLVREVVTAMGGMIRVESQPGTGATFIVSLPKG